MKALSSLACNTRWNLVGLGVPVVVAIFSIPPLINGLGAERFGVLAIGWAVMGYFALFDLGLGQATTKFVSEYMEQEKRGRLPDLIWNSFISHLGLGLFGGAVLISLSPWLINKAFIIPAYLREEAANAFLLLAFSVPLVVVSACLRGVLEAIHRFDLVNMVKLPASVLNYIGPLVILTFSNNLAAIIGIILASRALVLVILVFICLRVLPMLKARFCIRWDIVKKLLGFGGWLTVSSLVTPIITFLDRFFIAGLLSVGAVTYYATPYEVVTKLWIFSASLLGALFPVFSALSVQRAHEIRGLSSQAFHFLLVVVTPLVGLLLTFARELLEVWVGLDFAQQSTAVAKWLAVGVLVNVLAQVPYTILQSIGRADVVAKLQLMQLPLYALLMVCLGEMFGSVGVAMAWTVRALADAALMAIAANRLLPNPSKRPITPAALLKAGMILAFLFLAWVLDSVYRFSIASKALPSVVLLTLFIYWQWFYLLDRSTHNQVLKWVRQMAGVAR